jgi:xanthine/uracil permease
MSACDWIDRCFPPPRPVHRVKPREIAYSVDDSPPPATLLASAVQHAVLALMLSVYLVITGQQVGLCGDALHGFVALGLAIMGAGTLLNGLHTRVSPGHLLVLTPATIVMSVFIPVAGEHGLPAAAGGLVVGGLVVFAMGRWFGRFRVLFPPEVIGVLLILLGTSLLPAGVTSAVRPLPGGHASSSVVIAFVTLAAMTALSAWGRGWPRLLAPALGVTAGVTTAAIIGTFDRDEWSRLLTSPLFDLPFLAYHPTLPDFEPAAILPMVFAVVIGAVRDVGSAAVTDRMNNAEWHRADLPMYGRLLHAVGLGVILNGVTATLPGSCSAANLGLAHATGVTARRVGILAGSLLILASCVPAVSQLLIVLPPAVNGAILLYTAGYIMTSGMELILSRLLSNRRRATVGLSLAVGMGVAFVPEAATVLPEGLRPLIGSGLPVGAAMAIVLNLTLRLGTARRAELVLDQAYPQQQAARFLEERGMDWGARREVIQRAGIAIGEVLERLRQEEAFNGACTLQAEFDEDLLSLDLVYLGRALAMADAPPSSGLDPLSLDDDASIDRVMAAVSVRLVSYLADTTKTGARDGRAFVRLGFVH